MEKPFTPATSQAAHNDADGRGGGSLSVRVS